MKLRSCVDLTFSETRCYLKQREILSTKKRFLEAHVSQDHWLALLSGRANSVYFCALKEVYLASKCGFYNV